MTTAEDERQAAIFDVVAYLVNSAPTSLRETPSLAAFRMVDAASRLLALLPAGESGRGGFVRRAREECQAHFDLVMTDQDAFDRWLPGFARLCNLELMGRLGRPVDDPGDSPEP